MQKQKIYNRIAIKIGSNVLSQPDGTLNNDRIAHLVKQIARLFHENIQIVLISSGAVAAGRSEVQLSKKKSDVAVKQVWSAIGQVKLMSGYFSMFKKHDIQAAQVLTTKENFSDRRHYLNMKNCISAMLDNDIIPIVNENDTIAVTELMFTDNDELSGLIAGMMECEALFILSNVDGVFSGHPTDEGACLIRQVDAYEKNLEQYISPVKSGFGRGGMLTKCHIAQKISRQGIDVFIANGTRNHIISQILNQAEVPFTHFKAASKKVNGVKKWLAQSTTFAKGEVFINSGAAQALTNSTATSLLAIGIEKISGHFKEGDLVKIYSDSNQYLGIGKAQYGSSDLQANLGKPLRKPFIHYDYMVLNED